MPKPSKWLKIFVAYFMIWSFMNLAAHPDIYLIAYRYFESDPSFQWSLVVNLMKLRVLGYTLLIFAAFFLLFLKDWARCVAIFALLLLFAVQCFFAEYYLNTPRYIILPANIFFFIGPMFYLNDIGLRRVLH